MTTSRTFLLVSLLLVASAGAAEAFHGIATAEVEITPDVAGFPRYWVAGYESASPSEIVATGRRTALMAHAVALRDVDDVKVIVSADILAFPRSVALAIVQRVSAANAGFPEKNLLLVGTHTHTGPVLRDQPNLRITYGFAGETDPRVEAYTAWFIDRVANLVNGAIAAARASNEPIILEYGFGLAHAARNRAVTWSGGPFGQSDPEVTVLTFRNINTVRAVVYSYALHAVTQGTRSSLWSWDYPGEASAQIRAAVAGRPMVLFLPGAGGDQNPTGTTDAAAEVSAAALQVIQRAQGTGAVAGWDRIASQARVVTLPLDIRVPDAALASIYEGVTGSPAVMAHAQLMVQRIDAGTLAHSVTLPVYTWRFSGPPGFPSPVRPTIIAMGAEPVVDYALGFKRISGSDHALVVGYTNGHTGYLPTDEMIRLKASGVFQDYEAGWEREAAGQRIPGGASAPLFNDGWPAPLREGAGGIVCSTIASMLGLSWPCTAFPQARLVAAPHRWGGFALAATRLGLTGQLTGIAVDSDGGRCLYDRVWTGGGDGSTVGVWNPWRADPGCGGVADRPAVVTWIDGSQRRRVDVVIRDGAGQLWRRACVGTQTGCSGTSWRTWEPLGKPAPGASRSPALTTWKQLNGIPRLDMFVRGGDLCMWHRGWIANDSNGETGQWSAWTMDPGCGGFNSSPAADSWRDTGGVVHHDVFGVDTANRLWHRACLGSDTSCTWQSWNDLGIVPDATDNPDPVAVAWKQFNQTPRIDLFIQRRSGVTVCYGHRGWVGAGAGTWAAWDPDLLCGGFVTAPAAAAWSDALGRARIEVVGIDGPGDIWHRSWLGDFEGRWTAGWTKISQASAGF